MSERLACKAVGLARSTHRRLPQAQTPADPDVDVRAWLRAYATKHPCHGFRRAWAALRHDEGRAINVKKVHRLWCEEGLQRRVHSPRKRAGTSSVPEVVADAPKVLWALDFQFDQTADGRIVKLLHVVDEFTREALEMKCERRIDADSTVVTLDRLVAVRGCAPEFIRCDNGPELTANALRDWCRFSGAGTAYIEPGSPWQNPYVESFNSRVRDELLAVELFSCLAEAKVMVADWRDDYNEHRPHSALAMKAPARFARDWQRNNPPGDQAARGISLRSPSGLTTRDTAAAPSTTLQSKPDHRLSHQVDR